jgi:4-oxalocrotonate tautomerase
MPTIHITMFEGRTVEEKRKLVTALTDAVVTSLGAKRDSVRVYMHDIKRHDLAQGGILISDRKE